MAKIVVCSNCGWTKCVTVFGVGESIVKLPFCRECRPDAEDWPESDLEVRAQILTAAYLVYREEYPAKIKRDSEQRMAATGSASRGLFGTPGKPMFSS